MRELIISGRPQAAQPPQPASISCPDFDGTADQRECLQQLLNKHATAFTKDDSDLGYTDAATTTSAPLIPSQSPNHIVTSLRINSKRCRITSGDSWHRRCFNRATALRCTSRHRPQERWQHPPQRRLQEAQCKDGWRRLPLAKDPRVVRRPSWGQVLLHSGPGQWLPPDSHASGRPAQDSLCHTHGLFEYTIMLMGLSSAPTIPITIGTAKQDLGVV